VIAPRGHAAIVSILHAMSREFYEEGSRLLTADAFDFVLQNELQRAIRSQNFLTVVVVEVQREWEGVAVPADQGTLREVAQIVGAEVRDTDLLTRSNRGVLLLALLDADFEGSTRVIDRVVSRIENYQFPTALRLAAGAACYPTDAIDAESLKRQAIARPVVQWRGGPQSVTEHH